MNGKREHCYAYCIHIIINLNKIINHYGENKYRWFHSIPTSLKVAIRNTIAHSTVAVRSFECYHRYVPI